MNKLREEFEKLPEIQEILLDYKSEVVFHELENKYITPCYETFVPEYVYTLNGAWYAYQEQQKAIDELLQHLDYVQKSSHKSISYEYDLFDKGWNQCARNTVETIHRLTGIGEKRSSSGS